MSRRTARAVRSFVAALAVLAPVSSAVSACSNGPNGQTNDSFSAGSPCVAATECPDASVPSYAADIVPILDQNCIPCHSPGGTAGFDETSYAKVKSQFGDMLSFVNDCQMPPSNGPQMTVAARVALTEWLRCGAPDN
jgi:hypothetical protein